MDVFDLSPEDFQERSERLSYLADSYADYHNFTLEETYENFSFELLQVELDRYHYEEMSDQERYELAKEIQNLMGDMDFEHDDYEKAFYE